jgi:hypothetical protein
MLELSHLGQKCSTDKRCPFLVQRKRRDHDHPTQPPIISTPPNGVTGPNTARHPAPTSNVAKVTKAMMLQENKTVPTHTASSAN